MVTNSSSQGYKRGFATTRWSMVIGKVGDPGADQANALSELCQGYRYPVYAYLRRSGHEPKTAGEINRVFQLSMIRLARMGLRPDRGQRFRDFLLTQLDVFLAKDWYALEAAVEFPDVPPEAELEARNLAENDESCTPVEAYQRSFANEVIARAFRRLRNEADANGHIRMYEAMLPFVAQEPEPSDYEELSGLLGVRPLTLVVALKRLRQRFRELVGEELSDTVDTLDGLIEEQKTLHGFLRRPN